MKFSEFLSQTSGQQEAPKGEVLDLSLGCHTCFLQSDEAEYFPTAKILRWTCPEGHLNYIEDWSMF